MLTVNEEGIFITLFTAGSTEVQHRAFHDCAQECTVGIAELGLEHEQLHSNLPAYPYTALDVQVRLGLAGGVSKERRRQRPGPQFLGRSTEEGLERCGPFGIFCGKFCGCGFVLTDLCVPGTLVKTYRLDQLLPLKFPLLLVGFHAGLGRSAPRI